MVCGPRFPSHAFGVGKICCAITLGRLSLRIRPSFLCWVFCKFPVSFQSRVVGVGNMLSCTTCSAQISLSASVPCDCSDSSCVNACFRQFVRWHDPSPVLSVLPTSPKSKPCCSGRVGSGSLPLRRCAMIQSRYRWCGAPTAQAGILNVLVV